MRSSPSSLAAIADLTRLECVGFLGIGVYMRVMAMVREWTLELILWSRLPDTLFKVSARDGLQSSQIAFYDILLLCIRGPDGTGYDEIALRSTHWTGLACLLAFGIVVIVVMGRGTPASNTLCKVQTCTSGCRENLPRQKAWSQLTRRPYVPGVS